MFVLGIQYDKLFVTNGYNSFIKISCRYILQIKGRGCLERFVSWKNVFIIYQLRKQPMHVIPVSLPFLFDRG